MTPNLRSVVGRLSGSGQAREFSSSHGSNGGRDLVTEYRRLESLASRAMKTLKTVGVVRRWAVTGFMGCFVWESYDLRKTKQEVDREREAFKHRIAA